MKDKIVEICRFNSSGMITRFEFYLIDENNFVIQNLKSFFKETNLYDKNARMYDLLLFLGFARLSYKSYKEIHVSYYERLKRD